MVRSHKSNITNQTYHNNNKNRTGKTQHFDMLNQESESKRAVGSWDEVLRNQQNESRAEKRTVLYIRKDLVNSGDNDSWGYRLATLK